MRTMYDSTNAAAIPADAAMVAGRTHDAKGRFAKEPGGHGTTTEYFRGCRCDDCRAAFNRASLSRYYLHHSKARERQRIWASNNKERKLRLEQARIGARLEMLARIKMEAGCADCGYCRDSASV